MAKQPDRPSKPTPKSKPRTKAKKRIYRTYYKGAILTIYEKIIRPAIAKLSYEEDESALSHGLKRFFHVDTRSIYFARALREFTIPGKEWLFGKPGRLGYAGSPRRVAKGDTMVIRLDITRPDRVEIEFGEAVFVIDRFNWQTVSKWVELVA